MFAMRVEGNVFFYQHLVIVVFILKESGVGSVLGIQAGEDLLYVHLCYSSWRSVEAVVREIEAKYCHDFPEMFFDAFDLHFVVHLEGVFPHRRFKGRKRMAIIWVSTGVPRGLGSVTCA